MTRCIMTIETAIEMYERDAGLAAMQGFALDAGILMRQAARLREAQACGQCWYVPERLFLAEAA